MRGAAEARHEAMLWGEGASYPAPVIAHVVDGEFDEDNLAEDLARRDDAFWARLAARLWVTPQAFTNWWVARRWVVPRDIRKE